MFSVVSPLQPVVNVVGSDLSSRPTTLRCTFRRIGLLSLYIFFESKLIPTLFLILGWGYQPERVQAGIYLLFYNLLASISLLVGILFVYNSRNLVGLELNSRPTTLTTCYSNGHTSARCCRYSDMSS
jgi:hypothetical protein